MRARYLLPCQCGNQIPVDTRQAGQEVLCDCGATLEVPTLKGVMALPRVEVDEGADEAQSPATSGGWGGLHGAAVMGGLLLILGSVLFAYHRLNEPAIVVPDADLGDLAPIDSFYIWQELRPGPVRDLQYEKGFLPALAANKRWQYASLAMAMLGALSLAGSLFAIRGRSKRGGPSTGPGVTGKRP